MNINAIVEKAVQAELGAKDMEIIKLRAVVAGQAAEIKRLMAEIAAIKGAAPELPLPADREGASNGAHH